MSLLYFVARVWCHRKESSRSLSHLLMSFLFVPCLLLTCPKTPVALRNVSKFPIIDIQPLQSSVPSHYFSAHEILIIFLKNYLCCLHFYLHCLWKNMSHFRAIKFIIHNSRVPLFLFSVLFVCFLTTYCPYCEIHTYSFCQFSPRNFCHCLSQNCPDLKMSWTRCCKARCH